MFIWHLNLVKKYYEEIHIDSWGTSSRNSLKDDFRRKGWTNVNFGPKLDVNLNPADSNNNLFDFGFGLTYHGNRIK